MGKPEVVDTDDALSDSTSSRNRTEPEGDLPPVDVAAALALLQSWCEEDTREQQETWDYLKVALDEDRLSDRKLFP